MSLGVCRKFRNTGQWQIEWKYGAGRIGNYIYGGRVVGIDVGKDLLSVFNPSETSQSGLLDRKRPRLSYGETRRAERDRVDVVAFSLNPADEGQSVRLGIDRGRLILSLVWD